MLNVITAVSLETLAEKLIDDLCAVWKNPFDAPVVIFPDSKIEQWFRLEWLKKNKVLANLNSKRLDRFLFDLLAGNEKSTMLLTSATLRNIIISYLTQKNGDSYNYELLDPTVKNYVEDDGKLNEFKLFDFALTLANIFKEYEISRPSDFIQNKLEKPLPGLIETWKNEKDFFHASDGHKNEKEDWQRKLYSEIFLKPYSVIDYLHEHITTYGKEHINFFTLPQLYEQKRDSQTNYSGLNFKSNTPVFIFGISGIGQFYRTAIAELAKNCEIRIFAQIPSKDVIDKNNIENELLKSWCKAGFENIHLLLQICNNYEFIENKTFENSDTFLGSVKESVINNRNSIPTEFNNLSNGDLSLSVTAAPSKVREVEVLHSKICRLLNGSDTKDGKPANFTDILVMSHNLDDYRTAILEVFAQAATVAEEEKKSEEKTVVSVPFKFIDASAIDSLTANALDTLFAIREKGALTRPDFFSLVRNPIVQIVRGIEEDEIKEWEKWITDMNIYRDRTTSDNKKTGWLDSVKRLLLAKLSNEAIFDGIVEYSPYANIASSNSDSLCRFIDCVESLENWLDTELWFETWKTENITSSSLDSIMDFIDSWLLMLNPSKEYTSEAIVYRNISAAKENLVINFACGSETISWKILSQTLLCAAQNADYNSGNLFVNGITFMQFAPNRNVPVKYAFILGADAESLPGRDNNNTLDLRNSCEPWLGDDSVADKNRFAFLNQMLNTSEGLYLSYVNKDLQKDEDFYPTSIINDLRSFLKKATGSSDELLQDICITLDENRPWNELFTKREIRNKLTQHSFNGIPRDFSYNLIDDCEPIKVPAMVRFYHVKAYLYDPFEFQVNRILGIEEEEEDPEKTIFEPVTAKYLDILKYKRMLIALKLGIKPEKKIASENDFIKVLKERGIIPDGVFGERVFEEILDKVDLFVKAIKTRYSSEDYTYKNMKTTSDVINSVDMLNWKLVGDIAIIAENEKEIHIIDITNMDTIKNKQFVSGYVAALGLLSQDEDFDKDVFVDVFAKNKKGNAITASMKIDTSVYSAKMILADFYDKAFIRREHRVIPFDLIPSEELDYEKYINSFVSGNSWKYFTAARLFSIIDECGFSPDRFREEWEDAVLEHKGLMADIWKDIKCELIS